MNQQEKTLIAEEVIRNPTLGIRELCNRDFYFFLQAFWPVISADTFKPNWHIEFLCSELQKIGERVALGLPKEYDLIINVPPGTTKTVTCSIMFPVWCWTRWHWMRFITASYSADLSLESAEYSRDIVRSTRFSSVYPEIEIRKDKDTKGNFRILKNEPDAPIGGNRFSTSVGGTLTGFHGHILIVDDPLDPKRAASELELNAANYWIDQTLSTRKVDKAITPTILIMQRLHQNDPSGHLLDMEGLKINHICLPGEINTSKYKENVKPSYLVDNYIDGLLDPIRMATDVLEEMEIRLGQYGYAGQVGQDPTPPSGGMFQVDRFIIVDIVPDNIIHVVRYWDKAGTEAKKGVEPAWTVGTKMAKLVTGRFVVMDVKRGRWSSEVREKIIRATAEADGHDVEQWVEQEPGSGGKESAEATIRNLAGYVVKKDVPTGDKARRADPFSVQVNNGNVMLLKADWNREFKEEYRYFPFSKFKDQVDSGSGAFSKLVQKRIAGPVLRRR